MDQQQWTPVQLASALGVIAVFFTVLLGVIASIAYWIYRVKHKIPFRTARGPLATVGFIDCVFIVALFLLIVKISPQFIPSSLLAPNKVDDSTVVVRADEKLETATAAGSQPSPPSLPLAESTDQAEEGEQVDAPKSDAEADLSQAKVQDDAQTKNSESPWGEMTQNKVLLSGALSVVQLICVLVAYVFIRVRTGASSRSLGLRGDRILPDFGVGVWVMLSALPFLFVFTGLVNAFSGVEYSHPIIEMLRKFPWLFGVIAWMAVIVAPISEEFFFRTMLIGWLESVHFGMNFPSFFGGHRGIFDRVATRDATAVGVMPADGLVRERTLTRNLQSPYVPQSGESALWEASDASVALDSESDYLPPWWPAIVSGVLFGLAHVSYGVSWIPLILFGIVLGRVYQLRQSLITCIAFHMVFNAINLTMLWLSLGLQGIKPN